MQTVACVWLPNWPLQRLRYEQPELKTRPIVIYSQAGGRGARVVSASKLPRDQGVKTGMSLTEAKALLECEAGKQTESPLSSTHYQLEDSAADVAGLKQLALCCERFTPRFGIEESSAPESLWLDLKGSMHLFGGEHGTAETLTNDFRENGLQARIGLAPTLGAAWAATRCLAGPSKPIVVPADKLVSVLDPLPVAALRLTPPMIDILHELGLRTIRQLRDLPRSTLPSRFSPLLLHRLDQALGTALEQLVPERPPEPIVVEWAGEFPLVDHESLLQVCRELVEQLLQRLTPRRFGLRHLQCELRDGSRRQHVLDVRFVVPVDQQRHVFEMLCLQFERGALPTEIVRVRLEALAAEPQRVVQRDLFGNELNSDRQRDVATLIDRLSNRLGADRVVRARLQPEIQPELAVDYEAWTQQSANVGIRSANARSSSSTAELERAFAERKPTLGVQRPTRLLTEPQPIAVSVAGPEGAPHSFWWQRREHRVIRSWGPERIETGWWRETPACRDYFRVETQVGHHFWIFHCYAAQDWFVHGTFD